MPRGYFAQGVGDVSLWSKKLSFRDTPLDLTGVFKENGHHKRSIMLLVLSKYMTKMSEKVEGQRERIIWN